MKARTKLEQVEIRGYKSVSYDHPLTLHLGDINIMLGANGAGKSNIISFFRMLNYMMNGAFQKYVAANGTNLLFPYYGPKITPRIEGTLIFSNTNRITDTYNFALSAVAAQRLIIAEENIQWQNKQELQPYKKQLTSNYLESGLVDATDVTSKIIRTILLQCKAYQFHDSSSNGALRQASKIDVAQYLQSEGNNLASFLLFLRENYNASYKRIVGAVQMIMPSFGDFYLEPVNSYVSLNWTDNSANDYVFSPDQFSDGTIRFIALATLLLQPENTMPSVIMIDEPELGLHPFAIGQLAELIRDASLHAQILISTQSPMLIDEFEPENIIVVENSETDNYTIAKQLTHEQLKDWLADYSISELWTKNVIGGQPL